MRISAKGRYGLAAMIYLGRQKKDECVPVIHIAEKLDISKIYLEQVFSILKKEGLVTSVKGSHGGYQLTASTKEISVYQIMKATEAAVFEVAKEAVTNKVHEIDQALVRKVFTPLDDAVAQALSAVTLADLVEEVERIEQDGGYMFFI